MGPNHFGFWSATERETTPDYIRNPYQKLDFDCVCVCVRHAGFCFLFLFMFVFFVFFFFLDSHTLCNRSFIEVNFTHSEQNMLGNKN